MNAKNLIEYLIGISNENLYLNLGMHLFVIASLVTVLLLKSSKVRQYVIEGTILVLFISVTINAIIFGNPFHIFSFSIMAITAGCIFVKKKNFGIEWELQADGKTVVSFSIIILGLWYPELVDVNYIESLVFSPVGVIPCPTLITVLGIMNLFSPYVNKKLLFVTVLFGIFYGFIGTVKLGVFFDIVLICAVLFSVFVFFKNKVSMKVE